MVVIICQIDTVQILTYNFIEIDNVIKGTSIQNNKICIMIKIGVKIIEIPGIIVYLVEIKVWVISEIKLYKMDTETIISKLIPIWMDIKGISNIQIMLLVAPIILIAIELLLITIANKTSIILMVSIIKKKEYSKNKGHLLSKLRNKIYLQ